MQFSFEVGEHEKHTVSLSFDQMMGSMRISVDGQDVVNELRMFSIALVKKYEFVVGTNERHTVRIEKRRKLFLAWARNQKYSVYVDGRLVQEYEGM